MATKTRSTSKFIDQNLEYPHLLFNYPSKESLKPKFVFPDQNTQKHPRAHKPTAAANLFQSEMETILGKGERLVAKFVIHLRVVRLWPAMLAKMRGNAIIIAI